MAIFEQQIFKGTKNVKHCQQPEQQPSFLRIIKFDFLLSYIYFGPKKITFASMYNEHTKLKLFFHLKKRNFKKLKF